MLTPALLEKRDNHLMPVKTYSDEFRRDAVELYETTPGATIKGIARDLGINTLTLTAWIKKYGTGAKTPAIEVPAPPVGPETPQQKVARLEAENASLRAEKAKLETEKQILHQAAKYVRLRRRTGEPLPVRR